MVCIKRQLNFIFNITNNLLTLPICPDRLGRERVCFVFYWYHLMKLYCYDIARSQEVYIRRIHIQLFLNIKIVEFYFKQRLTMNVTNVSHVLAIPLKVFINLLTLSRVIKYSLRSRAIAEIEVIFFGHKTKRKKLWLVLGLAANSSQLNTREINMAVAAFSHRALARPVLLYPSGWVFSSIFGS